MSPRGSRLCVDALLAAVMAITVIAAPADFVRQVWADHHLKTQETPADDEAGFVSLFDGVSLAGWDGDPRLWQVEDGAIVGRTSAEDPLEKNSFLIWTGGDLDDFELRFSYRIGDAGNSGVQFRSRRMTEIGSWVVGGYQADIDAANEWSGTLYEERGRGVLAKRGESAVIEPAPSDDAGPERAVKQLGDPAVLGAHIRSDAWNEYKVVAQGNHLVQWINGQRVAEVTDNDPQHRRQRGILALQIHVGPPMVIKFKDIRLKRLGDLKKNGHP